jgi:hypothetical protein
MESALRSAWALLIQAMTSWHQWKLFIEHAVSIGHDALHVIVGATLWLAIALVIRRPVTNWRPWLWTFAVIMWNEVVDLWTERWPNPGHQYGEGAKDLLLTMFVPTLIMFAARVRPSLFQGSSGRGRRR